MATISVYFFQRKLLYHPSAPPHFTQSNTGDGLVHKSGDNTKLYTRKDGLPHRRVLHVERGPDGNLWLGTQRGLSIFDGLKFKNYYTKDGLPSNVINDIYFDPNGDVYLATGAGVTKFNGESLLQIIFH